MNTLFLHFNTDGTIKKGSLDKGGKVQNLEIGKLWEQYQILVKTGAKPIIRSYPSLGEIVHMINY